MAKIQRRSINDALAEIAAQAPTPNVAEVPRDHVTTRPHEQVPQGDVATVPVVSDHVARDHVTTGHVGSGTDADGYRVRVRREKPHVSLYAHPKVFSTIRDLAAAQRRKPHDLYAEGMRLMLARYGFDFDKLNRGE